MKTLERETLRGLGPFLRPDLCPACRMLRDAPPKEQIDIAFCYGAAVVAFRGAPRAMDDLCTKHRAMVTLLVREATNPSGDGF